MSKVVGQQATAATGSAVAHTAVAENVAVRSVVNMETQSAVNMENTQKMAALLGRLGIFILRNKLNFDLFFLKRHNSSTN